MARDAEHSERITTLNQLARAEESCRRCPLYRDASQAVPGEGREASRLMLVGEQPGDQEDKQGHPFVGPAGRLLDRALDDAGIDRKTVFVTNAVKHFKFEQRGKRRLHKKPSAGEIEACRWWLDLERALVEPRLIVAMGTSAARGVFGRPVTISKVRGRLQDLETGGQALVTVHPSALLRTKDERDRKDRYRRFVADLEVCARAIAES